MSGLVDKFACYNLSSDVVPGNLLNSEVVIYLSWLGLFFNIFNTVS